ncbi:thermonuclease family protein [Roseixanthobacter glucoisosaccharinicivorans]|uniref:thermonuclease family protein n=1 Tax=Roseixanthobacter glucoisosaccharinicivorans TaxID=3119923 RepID=UPI00372A454B
MRLRDLLTAAALLLALAALAALLTRDDEIAGPAFAVDGDTLRILDLRVRLDGIDAPELAQTCGAPRAVWPCGAAAHHRLAQLLDVPLVTCRLRGTDVYGRRIGTCTARGRDVARVMVEEGLALALSGRTYKAGQEAARRQGLGLWAGPFQRPADWRADHPR